MVICIENYDTGDGADFFDGGNTVVYLSLVSRSGAFDHSFADRLRDSGSRSVSDGACRSGYAGQ